MTILEQVQSPYFIVAGACVILLLLLYARSRVGIGPANKTKLGIGNGQIIGTREEQDDYFSTAATPYGTAAVMADGISGLSHGRMASTLAVSAFIREFYKLDAHSAIPDYLDKAASISNRCIMEQLAGSPGGTTLVAAVVTKDNLLYWGAVGDSIITVFRKGEFIPVNHRHILETVLEEKVLAGAMTKDEALSNPQKARLTNYLGYEGFRRMEISEEPVPLQPGDKVVLCSDGVTNTLSELELERILAKPQSPNDAAQEMMEAIEAKRLANQDNATVIILEIGQ